MQWRMEQPYFNSSDQNCRVPVQLNIQEANGSQQSIKGSLILYLTIFYWKKDTLDAA
jgi:hypothetical protein